MWGVLKGREQALRACGMGCEVELVASAKFCALQRVRDSSKGGAGHGGGRACSWGKTRSRSTARTHSLPATLQEAK